MNVEQFVRRDVVSDRTQRHGDRNDVMVPSCIPKPKPLNPDPQPQAKS